MEEATILRDLTLVVGVAAVVTVVFHLLRLPVILGYLLAGLIIGPSLPELPNLKDASVINQLSELGVVFLMFTIGLGFDLGRVQRVFWPALLAVSLQTALAFFIGMLCAPLVGYTQIEGIFLGAVLTNSASMVCLRLLRDQNRLNSVEAQLAIGLLVFEDIVAVLLLVILGGVSVSGHIDFGQAPFVIIGVAIFVVAVYFFGRMAAAKLTTVLKRAGSVELITLVSVALVLAVGWLASELKLSVALGAFLAGAILAQSNLSKEIERVTEPLRDLFCAVFFVAIGMLINPTWIWNNLFAVIGIALLVVVGKLLACWLGFFLGGAQPEVGFRASLPKASVGEFGFILAAMGFSQGITGDGLTSMTVGLAITTYLIMPVVNAKPDKLFHALANRCPDVLKRATRIYASMLDAVGRYIGRSAFARLARRPLLQVVFYFLVLNSIIASAYIGSHLLENWAEIRGFEDITQLGVWIVAAGLCLPFLTAILRNLDVLILLVTDAVIGESRDRQTLLGGMKNLFHTLLLCVVLVLFGGLYLSAASYFFPSGITLIIFLLLCGVALVLFWRSINQVNSRIEFLFYQSFQQHSRESDEQARETALKEIAGRNPWEAQITEHELSIDSVACGKELKQLKLRSETGAQVIAISRGGMTRFDPSPHIPLFPGDHVILYGESEQVSAAIRMLEAKRKVDPASTDPHEFRIEKTYIGGHSDLVGRTLATAQLRKEYSITVLGIQRGKKRIVSPPADELIQLGDILLVAGRSDAVAAFMATHQPEDLGEVTPAEVIVDQEPPQDERFKP
ncbi:cation:proton antiporter [Cerasicoccus fimbriatus]|uniref:cation:proton antiporter n=1 Tax=Cerasicoccus fimbriatus TaxID=3014554 RepID=UPI0022B38BDE|nr:cation:proton antiporter [Cerasicoccus sp. TK19100]